MARQTLLNFRPVSRQLPTKAAKIHKNDRHPKPAVELPGEIWSLILEHLEPSTLTLKTFRLVCHYWANVGVEPLFRVAYIDAWTSSWSRLKALCCSPHAHYVQKIQWNPLVLHDDCLDSMQWASTYPNLLKNASYGVRLDLHDSFRHAYKLSSKRALVSVSTLLSLGDCCRSLYNCRELVLSDTSDIESICADGATNIHVQTRKDLWTNPYIWAKNAQSHRKYFDEQQPVRDTMDYVVQLAQTRLSHITILSINLWETNYSTVFVAQRHWSRGRRSFPILDLHSICFRLKSCRMGSWDILENLSDHLDTVGIDTSLLPYAPWVRDISLAWTLTDPGPDFMNHMQYRWLSDEEPEDEDNDSEISTHSSTEEPSTESKVKKFSDLVDDDDSRPPGFTPDMFFAWQNPIHFQRLRLKDLNAVTLGNVKMDLGSLIFWLADTDRNLISQPLQLRFTGHTFLHGIDKHIFLATLDALGVSLSYDKDTTFYQRDKRATSESRNANDHWQFFRSLEAPHELNHKYLECEYPTLYRTSRGELYGHEDYYDYEDPPVPPLFHHHNEDQYKRHAQITKVIFLHPPKIYNQIIQRHVKSSTTDPACYFYICSDFGVTGNDGVAVRHLKYQWIPFSKFKTHKTAHRDLIDAYVVIRLDIGPSLYEEDYLYDWEERVIDAAERWPSESSILPFDELEHDRELAIYEAELLAQDLTQRYDHQNW